MNLKISPEIIYILLVLGLFVVPRALQRFRLPSAITCLALGAGVGMGFHKFHDDSTVKLLATLGIVTMFLFAGLEVDLAELKEGRKVLLQHVFAQLVLLAAGAGAVSQFFHLEVRAALLFALAVFTPSAGFILDTLGSFGLTKNERFWVKSKAISAELVALAVLFFTVQSTDLVKLGTSALALVVMVGVLPPVFRVFARVIHPFAPKAEFSFLIIVALLCSYITRELGVYYLVGAFVVGLTAVRLRKDLPELSSERLLGAVELFASFFIPFYFFKAGLHFKVEQFYWPAPGIAALLLLVVVPLRIGPSAIHRKIVLKHPLRTGARIGTAMIPTLVFTIVIAGILLERFNLPPVLYGALVVFTLANTLIPGFFLRMPPPEFATPRVSRMDEIEAASVPPGVPSADGSGRQHGGQAGPP